MALDGTFPMAWETFSCSFTAGNGTAARILVDTSPARVLPAIAGEVALPGETTVAQRVLTGGCRLIDGTIASTDGTARSLLIYFGREMTAQADTPLAVAAASLTRTIGSFLADGWQSGDAVMIFGAAGAANNGKLAQVTAVTATVLTLNGTPFTTEAALPAGARLVKVALRTRKGIPANAGYADATPNVALPGGGQDASMTGMPADSIGWQLGARTLLIVAPAVAVSTLPAQIDVTAHVGLY
ncbi:MAG: hypothetical protein K2Q10_03910 [Rhodospirillales bacterium]|nr:hypothetical protein [Rhodospirillales bacterium]